MPYWSNPYSLDRRPEEQELFQKGWRQSTAVLALDPDERDPGFIHSLGLAARYLSGEGASLQPLAVLEKPARLRGIFSRSDVPNESPQACQRRLWDLARQGLLHQEPEIIEASGSSRRFAVRKFLQSAKKAKAELIVTGSRAKARDEWVPGGFTESLLAVSPIPVLIVREGRAFSGPICSVLYPTDFSHSSRHGFNRLLVMARQLNAKVILYHRFDPLAVRLSYGWLGVMGPGLWDDAYEIGLDEVNGHREKWMQFAERQGVRCEFRMDEDIDSLSSAICRNLTDSKADLLVLSLARGAYMQAWLGQDIRHILNQADRPVLILRERHVLAPAVFLKRQERHLLSWRHRSRQ